MVVVLNSFGFNGWSLLLISTAIVRSHEAPQLHMMAQSLDECCYGEIKEHCEWIRTFLNNLSTDRSRHKHREHQRGLNSTYDSFTRRRGISTHPTRENQHKVRLETWTCSVRKQDARSHEMSSQCERPTGLGQPVLWGYNWQARRAERKISRPTSPASGFDPNFSIKG